MSDPADNPTFLKLDFTSETTQQLKAAVDSAVTNGEVLSVTLTVSQEAHAALVEQLSSGTNVAQALIHSFPPPTPVENPDEPTTPPTEEEGEEEGEEDETTA